MTKGQAIFLIRVLYKSGNSVDFWVRSFEIDGGHFRWVPYGELQPLLLGADNIEAVWQVAHKEVNE